MLADTALLKALVVVLAIALGLAYVVVVRRSPEFGLLTFLLVIAFIPIWVEVHAVLITVSLASAVAAGTALALLSRNPPHRWTVPDLLMGSLFLLAVAPLALGQISLNAALVVVFVWATAYLLGRAALLNVSSDWLYNWTSVILAVVALLAVVEFVTGWHGLSQWGPSNANRVVWGTIQTRGGLSRSEGAFGHSIALGATLAIGVVLAVEARFRVSVRAALIMVMLAGTAVTLSRGAIVCAALGLVLCLILPPSARAREMRRALLLILVAGALVLVPFIMKIISTAGTEASGSAAYRGNLLELLPFVDLFGTTAAAYTAPDGTKYVGGFRSIDSQLLLFGITYGWLTLTLVLLLLLIAIIAVLKRKGGIATIAVVAQIPALATVALITQYAVFFWFIAGLAVSSSMVSEHARAGHKNLNERESRYREEVV